MFVNICSKFLVRFGDKLNKAAYEKPQHLEGDEEGTIAVLAKDPEIFKEFIAKKLLQLEE
jgi:hypothetical protein